MRIPNIGSKRGVLGAALYAGTEHCVRKDRNRTIRSALFGFLFFGPTCQFYYPFTQRYIRTKLGRGLVDQTVWSYAWNTSYILTHNIHTRKVKTCLMQGVDATVKGWTVWPLVHLVTYTKIPVNWRAAWILSWDFLWINYMARRN
ncbi:putative Mpv17/PMP22 family protein [Tetraselmis virus 1]|uniref:Putative Mpv17/PMP22 family protein n=1 Tax=Tetraselmis virus 1 TaxID=2060617 RepID=A0A2P0VP22_9VIRU|nr:putative Mpv17/PMP22 family protein [Tetraselmis virus 1]AUF82519.1 putative Mpv17/PMP22 family protein [Tetraselmis virus 1]